MNVIETIWNGVSNALLMAWAVWWALVLGFAISGMAQAWVPRDRIERALGGEGLGPLARATGLGAASSSCSYAAVAITRSLFAAGASAVSALAFQFASTNLVVELGIVTWVLIGWQFTLAEFVGGLLMIAAMALLFSLFVSPALEARARAYARDAEDAHHHHHHHHRAGSGAPPRGQLPSLAQWTDVAHNFRGDWTMLYKEIAVGMLLAGFVSLLGNGFFDVLLAEHAPGALRLAENVLVGPLIAVLSFVCSIGNIPLAAVLWSSGISFAGVIAFIFADLIILPIIAIYRKYYGARFAARIVALMFVTMVLAALAVTGLFAAAGLIPSERPARGEIFSAVTFNFTFVANILAMLVFAALFALTMRGGGAPAIGVAGGEDAG